MKLNRLWIPLLLMLSVMVSVTGCSLYRAKKDIQLLERTAELHGDVIVEGEEKPVGIVLLREESGKKAVKSYFIRYGTGPFRFILAPGPVYLFAFADENEDQEYDVGEPAAWYGGLVPEEIQALEGGKIDGLIIELSRQVPEGTDAIVRPREGIHDSVKMLGQVRVSRGEVVSLDDERFTEEKGREGLFMPVQSALLNGYGIFFLEPYEARKVPVLFVHGAGGCPQDFRALIKHLDRTKFQPWLYQYPSGLRLSLSSQELQQALAELYVKYRFERIAIVAHSMGGLVSRAAINTTADYFSERPRRLFVSISTPWDGVRSAEMGVRHSPVVIPVWLDVAPGSPFLKKLLEKPLGPSISYFLLFGVVGGKETDGSVPLESVISLRAQGEAERIYAFPEDHMSILRSSPVIERLNRLLLQKAW